MFLVLDKRQTECSNISFSINFELRNVFSVIEFFLHEHNLLNVAI